MSCFMVVAGAFVSFLGQFALALPATTSATGPSRKASANSLPWVPDGHLEAINDLIDSSNDSLPRTHGHPNTPVRALLGPSFAFGAWAQFCDDTDCSVNCGTWVDLSNLDCLKESGRQSVAIKSTGQNTNAGIVYSPADSCSCQQGCDQNETTGCKALNVSLVESTFSYRFVNNGHDRDACGRDNC